MKRYISFATICILLGAVPVFAASNGLDFIETADGRQSSMIREMVQWTHSRLVFKKTLSRVAIGQDAIMKVEVLDNNEVLALAKKVGRTSLIVWYTDNTSETFLFSVTEDLSVLRQALSDIHPKIRLTLAPDRAALILRGHVPTIKYKLAAETAARHYLDAGNNMSNDSNPLVVQSQADLLTNLSANIRLPSLQQRKTKDPRGQAAIINLIQVEVLPMNIAEKVKKAIAPLGGQSVTVSRIQKGDMPDDQADTLLLSGQVETQVDLIRILNLAGRFFTAERINTVTGKVDSNSGDIRVIANESGGIINSGQQLGNSSSMGRSGNAGGTGNNVKSNIGRAKLLSMANGRLLSTIEVRDLPQVRVAIQMYEVNRRSLRQWRPDFTLLTNGYNQTDGVFGLDGATNQALGSGQVENALQVLGGAMVNNFQVGSSEFAFDLLFSLLEKEGISRTLSRPNLTVLAGEKAVFRAGGEVPVPTSFSPNGISSGSNGGNNQGVFGGTEFKSFGIQLEVRAMVDEHDLITLDLSPSISTPDTLLTQQISASTGSSLNTAAFNVRNLNTTTRLHNGQPLIIGGLVSRDISDSRDFVPGISDIPLFGKLTESTQDADTARELIIIVTPTLVREPRHDAALWEFQTTAEMLQGLQLTSSRDL